MKISYDRCILLAGLLLAVAVIAAPSAAWAAGDTASATGDAKAKLIAPLTLTNHNPLDFGELIKNFSSGVESVTLIPGFFEQGNPTGTIVSSDNSKLIVFGGHEDGDFQLTGEPGEFIQVSAPASVELTKEGVAAPTDQQKLKLDAFTFRVNRGTTQQLVLNNGIFALEVDGSTDIDTGGTLSVDGDDETGSYSGSYTVTVSYQ